MVVEVLDEKEKREGGKKKSERSEQGRRREEEREEESNAFLIKPSGSYKLDLRYMYRISCCIFRKYCGAKRRKCSLLTSLTCMHQ